MLKRTWASWFVGVSLVLIVAFGSAAQTELVHWIYTPSDSGQLAWIKNQAELFEQEKGVAVTVNNYGTDYWEKIAVAAAGGVPPDVVGVYPSSAPPLLEQGLFLDLRPYLEREPGFLDQFAPSSIDAFTWDGQIWGVATSLSPWITYYRPDLFAAAGIPNPNEMGTGWDWEAVIAAGKATMRDIDGDGATDLWGVDQYIDLWRWSQWVHQAGGDVFDRAVDPTRATFLTPEVEVGLTHFLRHYQEGITMPADQGRGLFWEGRSAMIMSDGPGAMGIIKDASWDWDIAVLPHGPKHNGGMVFHEGFQIMKGSDQPDLAWEWIKWLLRPEAQIETMAISGEISAIGSVIGEYFGIVRDSFGEKAPESLGALQTIVTNPNNRGEPVVAGGNDLRWGTAGPIVYEIAIGNMSMRAGLEELQRRTTAFLTQGN